MSIKTEITTQLIVFVGWLDDIGLPQYKDMFSDARVDARMLHYMTVVSITFVTTVSKMFRM